jgi:hypothetical protein
LVGALAACGGDDNGGPPGTGGSGGRLDAGTGGSAGLDSGRDAVNDGADALSDARDASGGGGGMDVFVEATRDARADVVADGRADVAIDQSADAPADRGADVTPDVSVTPDAGDASAPGDAADSGAPPDVAVLNDVADAGSDAVSSPADASDAPTFSAVQFTSWSTAGADGGETNPSTDGGPLLWTAYYPDFGQQATIEGFFPGIHDFSGAHTLIVTARAVSGAATEDGAELFLEGNDGEGGFDNWTLETDIIDESGFRAYTINIEGQPVLSHVERVGIRLTAKTADAGVQLDPTVIEIQSVTIQ